jgi:hypothetical protein
MGLWEIAGKKIKFEEDQAILEILFAGTHSKSGVEASDDDDYFEEEVRAQKMFCDSGFAITNTDSEIMYPNALPSVFSQREKGKIV